MFEYEKIIYDFPDSNMYVLIEKATGLGIIEFMLRYLAWLCLKDDNLKG